CPALAASATTCVPRRRRYRPAGTAATVRARPASRGPPAAPPRRRARRLRNGRASTRRPAARQGRRKEHAWASGGLLVRSGGGIDQRGDLPAVALQRIAALAGDGHPGQRPLAAEALVDRHQPGGLELRQVARQVALAEPAHGFEEAELDQLRTAEHRE